MAKQEIKVPDTGGAEGIEVVEILVAVGDQIELEQSLVVLESDKASMEIPATAAGKVLEIKVKEGDELEEGSTIVVVETDADDAADEEASEDAAAAESEPKDEAEPAEEPAKEAPEPAAKSADSGGEATSERNVDVPDIGTDEAVELIELMVKVGDSVEEGDSICVLESDKASMEVPAPFAGEVASISAKEGDEVKQGDALMVFKASGGATSESKAEQPKEADSSPEPKAESKSESKSEDSSESKASAPAKSAEADVDVPDIGTDEAVELIEISVKVGDSVAEGDSICVLESDKASMEVPAPFSGEVIAIIAKEGDEVRTGDKLMQFKTDAAEPAAEQPSGAEKKAPQESAEPAKASAEKPAKSNESSASGKASGKKPAGAGGDVYAGPAVRKLARELGVDLTQVSATGPKTRILKEDIHTFVQKALKGGGSTAVSGTGSGIPAVPEVDFSKFGEITVEPLSRMAKLTGKNMHRSWLNVPHVTQFDDADITEMEAFRKSLKPEAEKRGTKMTPMPFIIKACAVALRDNPKFNASLSADGESLVYKQYTHIGMAVDTPAGLLVPVIKDVDKKTLWEIAEDVLSLAGKARDRKLSPNDMQGGCFTISSLGGMGGTGFTPIVNTPEVGILGVSKASIQPVWDGSEFKPRNMLPLALSYDHRVINGGDAGRFFTQLVALLSDIRKFIL